jgi:3-oxoacyl-[acyl-carrier-protein] synthase III
MTEQAVYITDSAAFLPNAAVDNDRMEQILGQVGERPSRARRTILRSNGIQSRHYAIDPVTLQPTHTNASLTAAAVRGLNSPHFDLNQLECLVCGTSIPDQLMPNHAVMVQGELGLPALEAVATAGVCLSGVSALKYAYLSVAAGQLRSAVATGSELSSAMLSAGNYSGEFETDAQLTQLEKRPELAFEKDFLRWMLSDGAGALLLQPQPRPQQLNLRIDWIDIFSYAGELQSCMYAGAIKETDGSLTGWARLSAEQRAQQSVLAVKQDVKLLNENIIHYTVEKPLQTLLEKRGLRVDAIDYFLPHYSSQFFRERLHEGLRRSDLDIPQERWFTNLAQKGNTGAAALYIMLDELLRSGRLRLGQRLLCYVPESGRFSTSFMSLTVV